MTIHPGAPPNHLAPDELRVRPAADGVSLAIDPARAGWRYLSFRALALGAGERLDLGGPGSETVVVVLAGGGLSLLVAGGEGFELDGRETVFSGKPWAAYLPPDCRAQAKANPRSDGHVLVAIAEALDMQLCMIPRGHSAERAEATGGNEADAPVLTEAPSPASETRRRTA